MGSKSWKLGVLLVSILLLVLVTPLSFGDNYDLTFDSHVQFGLVSHELHVSVPSSLYEYYRGITPVLGSDDAYATLVTPAAVKPIAENIRNLTNDSSRRDEDFANAVLSLVHQIPYNDSKLNYPIETLVENEGKCDTLSLLAASIMKAGGLDVVLLYFKGVHHINVGVYLPYEPHTTYWWLQPTGYNFNGKTYWIAECTPAMDWKVGDVPPLLTDEQPTIISLENSEESSPARVSSKLGSPLNSSSISINLSAEPLNTTGGEQALKISGSLSSACPNETVAVYFSQDGISYAAHRVETDYLGNYSFNWNVNSTGTYYVRTSWSGNENYTGADSDILTVFFGFPQSLIQFKGPNFIYTYGRPYVARHELQVRQGVQNFLNVNMSGTGILLTGDFIVVKSGEIITIPRQGETTESIKDIEIPQGLQPLRLPDDIEETTNNQFGFILQNSGNNNYTLNVKGLNDYEASSINTSGSGTAFLNTSSCIKEDTWYKVVAKISENEVSAELHDANGTLIESIATKPDAVNVNKLVILLTNNTDRAVAFRNLNIENLNSPAQPPKKTEKATNITEILAPYAPITILIAAVFAAVFYLKKRKSCHLTLERRVHS
jgi:hypothetical protein